MIHLGLGILRRFEKGHLGIQDKGGILVTLGVGNLVFLTSVFAGALADGTVRPWSGETVETFGLLSVDSSSSEVCVLVH